MKVHRALVEVARRTSVIMYFRVEKWQELLWASSRDMKLKALIFFCLGYERW